MNEFIEISPRKYRELLNKEAECEAYKKMAEGYKLISENNDPELADAENYELIRKGEQLVKEAEDKLKFLAVKYGVGVEND